MMIKKILTAVLSCSLVVGTLTGCTIKEEKKAKEITVMLPEWGMPTDELLNEFKKETGITVKPLPTSWDDTKGKVSVAAAGKKAAADVMEVDWSWVGEFKSAGWLEPLKVDEATKKDLPALPYFTVDKEIYALPYSNDVRLAYLNKEMAKKAGITETPKNWDELENVMAKIKENKVVEYPMQFPLSAEEKTTTSFMTLAYTRNNVIFNNDDTLNKESVLDTFNVLKKYLDKGYINPKSTSTAGLDTFRGINNGEGAFLAGPTSYVTSSNDEKVSKVVGQVSAIPMPGKEKEATKTIAFIEGIGVSSFSENKEEAKKFVEWFLKEDTQLKLNKAINNPPTRTSALEKLVADGTIKTPGSLVEQAKLVSSPFPNGMPKYYTKMSTEMFNIINQFAQGKLTPEQATDKMIEKVDELIKQNK